MRYYLLHFDKKLFFFAKKEWSSLTVNITVLVCIECIRRKKEDCVMVFYKSNTCFNHSTEKWGEKDIAHLPGLFFQNKFFCQISICCQSNTIMNKIFAVYWTRMQMSHLFILPNLLSFNWKSESADELVSKERSKKLSDYLFLPKRCLCHIYWMHQI